MINVAVYGTLKKTFGNHHVLGTYTFVGEGFIKGHRLYERGIPFVVKDSSSDYSIQVEVFSLPDASIMRVDALEGHPSWYKREITDIFMKDGSVVQAWLYKMKEQPAGTIENISGVYKR